MITGLWRLIFYPLILSGDTSFLNTLSQIYPIGIGVAS